MFHRFLVAETEVGNISRQEAVSMIPVLLLDIQPGHHVMDTCASPGSKTAQILEALHADGSQGLSSGLVVANDADTNRSYMLVKQAKRLQSPCLIVTNHEAQRFPSIHLTVEGQTEKKTLQFDRILADVPCSGDGTARKNLNLWKTWKALSGYGLHKMQLAILDRACELLKVGGRVVYSTCSLNPVENEAVVAAMLKLGNGTIELVDVSSHLPALKRRPGVSSWKYVNPKDGTVHTSMDTIPEETKRYGVDTFFPPEDSASLGLDRCLRVYPHLQDTGGFFVAVLQKVADYGRVDKHNSKLRVAEKDVTTSTEKISDGVSDNEENEPASPETKRPKLDKGGDDQENDAPTTSSVKSKTDKKAHQMAWNTNNESHDPFIFLGPDSEIVKEAQKLYGLKDGFPVDQFLVRTENENIRTIYFVSKDVKEILSAENSRKLKVVNTGIKVFSRHTGGVKEGGFQFRLNAEGVMTLAPHLSSNTVITTSYADLLVFLTNEYPKFECFSSEMQTKLTNSGKLFF